MSQLALNLDLQPANGGAHTAAGVTELVLSRDCPEHASLLYPMLAFLSRQTQNQWITWVAPEGIDRQLFADYGVDTDKIRLVYPNSRTEVLQLIGQALALGNSHTVIANPGKLNDRELRQLESAAHQGQTQGLLLRLR